MQNAPGIRPDYAIHQIIADQVACAPDSPALKTAEQAITYAQFDRRARQFAQIISNHLSDCKQAVAVLTSNDADRLAAAVGTWIAGHFVSLFDPAYPGPQIASLLEALSPACLVTDQAARLRHVNGYAPAIVLDPPTDTDPAMANTHSDVRPEDVAFVTFTSGSTGQPKGVVQTHERITHDMLIGASYGMHCRHGERLAAFSPPTAYATLHHLFNALMSGGLACYYDLTQLDLKTLSESIVRDGITQLRLTPTLLRRLIAAVPDDFVFDSMRTIQCIGEPLLLSDVSLVEPHVRAGCELFNAYGASEVGGIAHKVHVLGTGQAPEEALWLSSKATKLDVSVDDGGQSLTQPEITGELVVRGRFMARGYLKDGKIVRLDNNAGAESNPIQVHRTGDVFRQRTDGHIRYVGRKDFAMSIGGHLIHPAEIESEIVADAAITDVAVTDRSHPLLDRIIVAYLVGEDIEASTVARIRARLAIRLPVHMLPLDYVILAELPRTAGGKVDRKSLPDPPLAGTAQSDRKQWRPESATQARLSETWTALLGPVSVFGDSNFFALGGNSLKALELSRLLEQAFCKPVPLAAIYSFPLLKSLAGFLDGELALDDFAPSAIQVQAGVDARPFFCVHGDVERLAVLVPARRPVFRLTVVHDDAPPSVTSLEEQAAAHVADIRALYPDTPCVIGGFSYGGYVAMEMAHQMEAAGHPPDLVVLLDPLWFDGKTPDRDIAPAHLGTVADAINSAPHWSGARTLMSLWHKRLARVMRSIERRLKRARDSSRLSAAALEQRNQDVFGSFAREHVFEVVHCPVLLICPNKPRTHIERDGRGWARLCRGRFDILKIYSARLHFQLFDDHSLQDIARGIENALKN